GEAPNSPADQTRKTNSAAFADRIGVIFSASYNVFIDAEVLAITRAVAAKLATSAASSEKWASTELGRHAMFSDDLSRERVKLIFEQYADKDLQSKRPAARVRRERDAFMSEVVGVTEQQADTVCPRAMGLASLRLGEYREIYSDIFHKYHQSGVMDPFPLLITSKVSRKAPTLVNPLLLVTERK
ncbi:unnamed protein product, partial [Sphacelaria rigidula]